MSDDDKLLEKRNRAQRAKDLLDDEMLIEGFERLRQSYITAWCLTQPTQEREREILWLAVNAIGKVRDHLGLVMADGRLADAELNKMIKLQERKKFLGVV